MKKDSWEDFYEQFVALGGEDGSITEKEFNQLIETHQYFINARKRPPLTEEWRAETTRLFEEFKCENNRNIK